MKGVGDGCPLRQISKPVYFSSAVLIYHSLKGPNDRNGEGWGG